MLLSNRMHSTSPSRRASSRVCPRTPSTERQRAILHRGRGMERKGPGRSSLGPPSCPYSRTSGKDNSAKFASRFSKVRTLAFACISVVTFVPSLFVLVENGAFRRCAAALFLVTILVAMMSRKEQHRERYGGTGQRDRGGEHRRNPRRKAGGQRQQEAWIGHVQANPDVPPRSRLRCRSGPRDRAQVVEGVGVWVLRRVLHP